MLIARKSLAVDTTPTPTLTVPSPRGNTQPYPVIDMPLRSVRSTVSSIAGVSWSGEAK